jgi:hypothetical protein
MYFAFRPLPALERNKPTTIMYFAFRPLPALEWNKPLT